MNQFPPVSTTLAKLVAKFAAGVVETSVKFATGVVDTVGAPCLANISQIFEKNPIGILWGWGGT